MKNHCLAVNLKTLTQISEQGYLQDMASSLSQFSDNSDETKSDWKIPLAKLNSAVIQETSKAKEQINQLLLSGSRQCHVILGDLFNQYVMNNCSVAGEILLDQSQQSHVNVCIVLII